MRNIFILRGTLPSTKIENWELHELCYLYEHQIQSKASSEYIECIRDLIKDRVQRFEDDEIKDAFYGEGCCSEYRNSVRLQIERLKKIIDG